jgi:hypothetical protein
MTKGISLLFSSLGFDIEAIKRDMDETVSYVHDTLGAIDSKLKQLETDSAAIRADLAWITGEQRTFTFTQIAIDSAYTRVAVDRLYTAVTGGPPSDTATAVFAQERFAENPELEAIVYREIVGGGAPPAEESKLNG